MKEVCQKYKCTGCGGCVNVCPKQSISMQVGDSLGHLYPVIDQNTCIDCGLCEKTCPANHPVIKNDTITAFAGWDKNVEEYTSSTSGGAASAIGRYIIRQGGVVYGCSMQPGIKVSHIRVTSEDDLYKLKGSKYVQSTVGSAYKDAITDLKAGKKVLFIGTPCQVAVMKKISNKYAEHLYTIDLICHGVPSLKYLQQHAAKMIGGDIKDVIAKFRDSNNMYLLLLLLLPDGSYKELYRSNLWKERYKDTYYNAFIDGFTYRNSCHNCYYADSKRCSDLTVGDFWGLGAEAPFNIDHSNGCSVLLPLTERGIELINGIRQEFNLYERTVSEAVTGNDQLRKPCIVNRRISIFAKLHKLIGINLAYKLCTIDYRLKAKTPEFIKKIIRKFRK